MLMKQQKKAPKKWLSLLTVCAVLGSTITLISPAAGASPLAVNIQVDPSKERKPISPYIYGTNASMDLTGTENFTARRIGGNRMTGYNWENNFSNAGSDWYHSSDEYMCTSLGIPTSPGSTECSVPGKVMTTFHDKSLQTGAYSLLTLQMAGYVANDKNGEVAASQIAPSARWAEAQFVKPAPFSVQPDLNDQKVYMDEFVNFMVHKYGSSSSATGVKGYALDNEPALWSHTHERIHPNKVGAKELVDRSVALSKAVKSVDSNAEIFGGVLYGFNAYLSLQEAPDWNSVKGSHSWYIDYYLDQMKQASQTEGKRLLDVLDLHWYPEAQGGGQRITFNGTGNTETKKARLQAPRSLWDPTYQEDSWIGQYFGDYLPLLPRVKQSIDQYYPGTKLAFTEFTYGGEGDISGGLAMADVLGIFGKYGVYMSNFWQVESDTSYVSSAYKLYRNYDGKHSKFGSISVSSTTSDVENSSVHASVMSDTNDELHLIVMNKNMDAPLQANIAVGGSKAYGSGQVFGFSQSSPTISEAAPITSISNNSFTYAIPPLTAYHIVLKASGDTPSVPAAPADLQAITSDGSVMLSWNLSAGATSYNVKRATTSGGPYTTIASNVTTGGYLNSSLNNGTTYYYVVSAVNSAGESANSSEVSAKPMPSNIVPSVPSGLTAVSGDGQITLNWNPAVHASNYNIKRSTTSGGPYTTIASSWPLFVDKGLTNGTTYYYVVSATNVNSGLESANSVQVSATPKAAETPVSQLVLQYRAADTNAADNQIKPHFNIKNTGTTAVNLSDLKIRYYFSQDGGPTMNSWIDWAQVGGSNITRTFTDSYVELSFNSAAGAITAGGQSGEIQLRMSKADWSNFNEANDYSYDPTKTSFADWNRVTLYQNGTLVWGIEP
jgi:hypothetical protein